MDFMVNIDMKRLPRLINYHDKIMLTGSCFTEHIGNSLLDAKFSVLQNPNGILFDPASVCRSLISYIENKQYQESYLFQLNDVWHSWQHHSRFSNVNLQEAVKNINDSQQRAHIFLKEATWLIVTLGSSYYYLLTKGAPNLEESLKASPQGEGLVGAANCHRAPAQWFDKHLLEISETIPMLEVCYEQLIKFNPGLNIISYREPSQTYPRWVVENNRSKARLIGKPFIIW
jgi:hypothetical protein